MAFGSALSVAKSSARKVVNIVCYGAAGKANVGYCTICAKQTVFIEYAPWLRDNYLCIRCRSIPRFRGIIHVLESQFPNWRDLVIHESSPGSPSSDKIARECAGYSASQFFSDVPPGDYKDGVQSQNLERLTFADASFDLFITQDVMEHVMDTAAAFREIKRVLKPGGAHVFTVPVYKGRPATLVRTVVRDGEIVHLEPPDYHGNPIDEKGSLVIREWGEDMVDFVREHSGMETDTHSLSDKHLGLLGEFLQVYVSKN